MAFNASECAFEGFRLVRKRPAAFAAWCLFYLLFVIVAVGALFATLAPMIMQFAHPAAVQGSGLGGVGQVAAFVRNNLPILLVGAAVMIPLVLVWAVMMTCAIFRAVLRPDEKGFGYLRLGGDEVRMIGLYLLIFVLGLAAWLVVGGVALGGVAAARIGVEAPARVWAGVWAVVGLLGLLAFLAYVFVVVRLSLCAPQTFAERRITLFGSWKLTRGHFWGLFGMYLLVFAILIALQIVNAVLQLPFKAVSAHVAHGDLSGLLLLLVGGLAYVVVAFMIAVLNLVITAASRAAAYRELTPPKADAAAKAVA